MRQISETIFSGNTTVIPMADVQHVVKEAWGKNELHGYTVSPGPERISYTVITKHSRRENGKWVNAIILPHYEGAQFMKSWLLYRSEIDYPEGTEPTGPC